MSSNEKNRVCPVEHAGALDSGLRKILHNPRKILKPYISEGMKVLDLGCGPGFFSIEIARLVGGSGKVIAADLQEAMLEIVKEKIKNSDLKNIIELHKTGKDRIGLSEKVDFILLFYILHEVPDKDALFQEIKTLLKPGGKVLIIEPKFRVSKIDFSNSIAIIKNNGFDIIRRPKVFLSRSIVVNTAGK